MKVIINTETKEYFSLLGAPHFTRNVSIAQRFDNETDAVLCTEQYIDSTEGFEAFGMIDTQVININN